MSIATDVSRIKGNITAALAAIANKGVTVPGGSTSDALASLIASIEAGGGGGGNIAYGTITPADASVNLEIVHGLGKVPDFFCIVASNNKNGVYSTSKPNGQSFIYTIRGTYQAHNNWYYGRYQYLGGVGYGQGLIDDTLSTNFNYYIALGENNAIWAVRNSNNGLFQNPAPFFWLAIADEGIVQ